jgi:hypothetical protein
LSGRVRQRSVVSSCAVAIATEPSIRTANKTKLKKRRLNIFYAPNA